MKFLIVRVIATLIFFFSFFSKNQWAFSQTYQLSPIPSIPAFGSNVLLGGLYYLSEKSVKKWIGKKNNLLSPTLENITPFVSVKQKNPHQLSNISLAMAGASSIISLIGPTSSKKSTLVILQTHTILQTSLVTSILKNWIHVPRPYVKNNQRELKYRTDDFRSFPSGHTSMAFAFATSTALHMQSNHWKQNHKNLVIISAYTLATTTGILRIAAKKHRFLDVAVGAVIGTSIALLNYSIHEKL